MAVKRTGGGNKPPVSPSPPVQAPPSLAEETAAPPPKEEQPQTKPDSFVPSPIVGELTIDDPIEAEKPEAAVSKEPDPPVVSKPEAAPEEPPVPTRTVTAPLIDTGFVRCKALRTVAARGMPYFEGEVFTHYREQALVAEARGDLKILEDVK